MNEHDVAVLHALKHVELAFRCCEHPLEVGVLEKAVEPVGDLLARLAELRGMKEMMLEETTGRWGFEAGDVRMEGAVLERLCAVLHQLKKRVNGRSGNREEQPDYERKCCRL